LQRGLRVLENASEVPSDHGFIQEVGVHLFFLPYCLECALFSGRFSEIRSGFFASVDGQLFFSAPQWWPSRRLPDPDSTIRRGRVAQYYPRRPKHPYPPPIRLILPAQGYPAYRPLPPSPTAFDDNQNSTILQAVRFRRLAVEPVAPAPRYGPEGRPYAPNEGDTGRRLTLPRIRPPQATPRATKRRRSSLRLRPSTGVSIPNRTARGAAPIRSPARSADRDKRTNATGGHIAGRFSRNIAAAAARVLRPETGPKNNCRTARSVRTLGRLLHEGAGRHESSSIRRTPNLIFVLVQGKAFFAPTAIRPWAARAFTGSRPPTGHEDCGMARLDSPPEEMIVIVRSALSASASWLAAITANPLGARALYLAKTFSIVKLTSASTGPIKPFRPFGNRSYRPPACIRLTNDDVTEPLHAG